MAVGTLLFFAVGFVGHALWSDDLETACAPIDPTAPYTRTPALSAYSPPSCSACSPGEWRDVREPGGWRGALGVSNCWPARPLSFRARAGATRLGLLPLAPILAAAQPARFVCGLGSLLSCLAALHAFIYLATRHTLHFLIFSVRWLLSHIRPAAHSILRAAYLWTRNAPLVSPITDG